jgi:hypothetical protein
MSEQVTIGKANANAATGYISFSCSFAEAHKFVSGVLFKLIIFSLSLGIVPLSSYFLSLKYIWNGKHP